MSAYDSETCAASERKAQLEFAKASPLPPASLARPSLSFRSLFGPLSFLLVRPRSLSLRSLRSLRSLGCLFGALGRFLGALGCLFGALGCLLGAFGCLLGASWAFLGASWRLLGPLGAILGPLGAILGFQVELLIDFGSPKGAQREPKWHQNGTQNEHKSKTKFDTKKQLSKSILEPSWAVLKHSWR